MKKIKLIFALWLFPSFMLWSQKIVVVNETSVFVPSSNAIKICMPSIRYESIENEKELDAAAFKAENMSTEVAQKVQVILVAKGFNAHIDTQFIEVKYADFLRNPLPQTVQNTLLRLANDSSTVASSLFILDMKVKVGQSGSWDSNTGAITSKNHTTRLRAILIDVRSQTVLWKNEVLLRAVPKPQNNDLNKTILALFDNLKMKK